MVRVQTYFGSTGSCCTHMLQYRGPHPLPCAHTVDALSFMDTSDRDNASSRGIQFGTIMYYYSAPRLKYRCQIPLTTACALTRPGGGCWEVTSAHNVREYFPKNSTLADRFERWFLWGGRPEEHDGRLALYTCRHGLRCIDAVSTGTGFTGRPYASGTSMGGWLCFLYLPIWVCVQM
jgi:hypothetical protein